jgi:acetate kinase
MNNISRTRVPIHAQTILALNSGSSSLKLSLYQFHNGTFEKLAVGEAEEIGSDSGRVTLKNDRAILLQQTRNFTNADNAAEFLLDSISKNGLPNPDLIGHRIVHGGPSLREHTIITPDVLRRLDAAIPFAPLHLPPALEVVRHTMQRFAGTPQIACLDTAFHRTLPE